MISDVIVVGGGISGLASAQRMRAAGARVTLVEKSRHLGGMIQTERQDGFTVEGGPDSFVVGKGSVMALADELGLTDRVISSRPEHKGSFVWWDGRLHALPGGLLLMAPSRLGPLFGSSLLSWRGKLRVLADLVLPRAANEADESLESFVVRRLGREVLERIAEPLIAGIHAAEPATMSLRASFPRFLEMERRHRSLILAARSAASARGAENGLSYFASFKGGMGELTDALVGELSDVDVMTGVAATRLSFEGQNGYRLRLNDGNEMLARGVVLATPAPITGELLSETAPEAALAVASIRQVSTATVTLGYRSEDLPPLTGSGFVVPSATQRRIMGVSYSSQKWEGRVPSSDFTLLRAFVGGRHGQQLARGGTETLAKVVTEELEAILGIRAEPVFVRCHSWVEGLHQYTLGHLERVARAEAALTTRRGLALAGAGFHGIGLNECIDSGRAAADSVLSAIGDRQPISPTIVDSGHGHGF